MPIGNLTSQIFANIYLNELDRFVKYEMKPKFYLRYGDDFILIESDPEKLKVFRVAVTQFLEVRLKLNVNRKNDRVVRAQHGLKFLGVIIWPYGRMLNHRSMLRAIERLKYNNVSSYSGLLRGHVASRYIRLFNWMVYGKLLEAYSREVKW